MAIEFPESAAFGKKIPFAALQKQGVPRRFGALVHLAAELAGMAVRPGEPLKLFDERHYAVESLRAELADIEKKLSKEKQLNRKYELAKNKQRVLAKLEAVK